MVEIKALGGREKHCELEEGFGKSREEAKAAMSSVWRLGYDGEHASSTEREIGGLNERPWAPPYLPTRTGEQPQTAAKRRDETSGGG